MFTSILKKKTRLRKKKETRNIKTKLSNEFIINYLGEEFRTFQNQLLQDVHGVITAGKEKGHFN